MPISVNDAVVLLDWPATGVARLRINRPEKRNAIDQAVRQALIDYLTDLRVNPQCRALVLGGVGGVFSAGGDVDSMDGLTPEAARERMQHVSEVCRVLASLPMPVITAMEGITAGAGVGIALLGDETVMGQTSKIYFPFLRLGLVPDWGQIYTLPRRVGWSVARRLMSNSQLVDAETAQRTGIADWVCDDAAVATFAIERASTLSELPSEAYARMKFRLLHPSATLEEELAREIDDQVVCLSSVDFREGLLAFREKRRPNFIRGGRA